MRKTVVLVILDGWGVGERDEANAIYLAKPETVSFLERNFPHAALNASGISVGLPWGEPGSSEAGHLTLGAGRIVYQPYPKIALAIERGDFFNNSVLTQGFAYAKKNRSAVHVLGLLTEGRAHAALPHLFALIKMAALQKCDKLLLHLFTDGIDSPPRSSLKLIEKVRGEIQKIGVGRIASISGRRYAMDDNRMWERTEETYRVLTGQGAVVRSAEEWIKSAHQKTLDDFFIPPALIVPEEPIRDGDALIFFNFGKEQMRQIAEPFALPDFQKFAKIDFQKLFIATMTQYFETERPDFSAAFPEEAVKNTIGEVLAGRDMSQARITESGKRNHVTFFFNGMREESFTEETRIILPSFQIPKPEARPEMRAREITDRVLAALGDKAFDFIVVNYPNADAMAHTGDIQAAVQAVRVIDKEVGRIAERILNSEDILIITSDHGNAERVVDLKTGHMETGHEINPVPIYLVGRNFRREVSFQYPPLNVGLLSDVAPTVLELFGVSRPGEMTGESLLAQLVSLE